MSNTLDETLSELIKAPSDTPQWQLKTWMKRIHSVVPRHGISPYMIKPFVEFLCTTQLITTSTKVSLIEEHLIPNGNLNSDIIDLILKKLGTPTIYTKPNTIIPPKYVQVALCKWLVHVYFLLPNPQDDTVISTWLQLWQFDYLQEWITYILVWSTRERKDIKPWKVNLVVKFAKNNAYTNSKSTATLILKKYLTILGQSVKVSDAIDSINCSESEISQLQNLQWNSNFIRVLKTVLNREASIKYSNSVVEDKLDTLLSLLKTSEMDSRKLNFQDIIPTDSSLLAETKTIVQLYKNWNSLTLPRNVEVILSNDPYTIAQLFPLAFQDPTLSQENKTVQEFWIRMYSYVKIYLGRCFYEKQLTTQERQVLFDKMIQCCTVYNKFIGDIVNDFLTLPNLFSSRELFVTICVRLLPIMPPPEEYLKFRTKILKILAICLLTKSKLRSDDVSKSKSTFAIICYSIIQMISNWLTEIEDDSLFIYSLDLLRDIRKLLLSNVAHSLSQRGIAMSINLLIETITTFIRRYQSRKESTEINVEILDKVVFRNNVMNKLFTLDDPVVLNHCCAYLITVNKFIKHAGAPHIYVQLHNYYTLDLTNYLWRNKITEAKKLLGIPSSLIKVICENITGGKGSVVKLKDLFSFKGVAATSHIVQYILKELEVKNKCTVHYHYPMTEVGFRKFQKGLASGEIPRNSWIPGVSTFQDLSVLLLEEMVQIPQYRHIVYFLTEYIKSLSKVKIVREK